MVEVVLWTDRFVEIYKFDAGGQRFCDLGRFGFAARRNAQSQNDGNNLFGHG